MSGQFAAKDLQSVLAVRPPGLRVGSPNTAPDSRFYPLILSPLTKPSVVVETWFVTQPSYTIRPGYHENIDTSGYNLLRDTHSYK